MNPIDEATIIWGNKWNWYQQIEDIKQHQEFDKVYWAVSKHFNDNLYHDLLVFRYFRSFFGNFEMFLESLWDCDDIRSVVAGSKWDYKLLSDGTIVVIKNNVEHVIDKNTLELIDRSTAPDAGQALSVDIWLCEHWQSTLATGWFEESYPGKYVIHKFPQKEYYISSENIFAYQDGRANELYFFDSCANFLGSIVLYGISKDILLDDITKYRVAIIGDFPLCVPVCDEYGVINRQIIKSVWTVSEEDGQNLPPLLVDPRIAMELGESFIGAKKEADDRCGHNIIFTPQAYIDWVIEQDYSDLPVVGISPGEFMLATWEKIKIRLLDDWKNKIRRALPPEYRRAKDELDRARDLFRNGDFDTTVMLAGKCCEILCFFEYPNNERARDYTWNKLIDDHREDIINRYGHALWNDLTELRKKRNQASHGNMGYRPDTVEADGIIKRAEIVWNKFNTYRIQNPARYAAE